MTEQIAPHIKALMDADRELSLQEMDILKQASMSGWDQVRAGARRRARSAYEVAGAEEFAACVNGHMGMPARLAMITAEEFRCPTCGRLLKRRPPIAEEGE